MILGRGRLLVYDSLAQLQRSVDSSIRIRVAGDIDPLCTALRARGCQAEESSSDEARISGEGDLDVAVFEAARQCGVVVREIIPSRNSLEDTYLEAVRATEGKQTTEMV